MNTRIVFTLTAGLCAISFVHAGSLLEQGTFAAGSAGGPPPEPWILGKPKPEISLRLENPSGESGTWVHIVDNSVQDAAALVQKFGEISGGRLSFKLHVVRSGAAIWFLLGSKEVSGKADTVFSFKITSQGALLVSQGGQKLVDTTASKAKFSDGQTYDLYCDFKPNGAGLNIEMGQKDGAVLFKGSAPAGGPVSALAIRTHGAEEGSDFYVTDLALEPAP